MLKNNLSNCRSLFMLPRDNLAEEVLIPAFKASKRVRILMGYFSSASFGQIANGLATFLNENEGQIELIISPYLTATDRSVLMMDNDERRTFVENSMFDIAEGESDIITYCLACFGWLLAEGRLDIKIALVENGLFHPKVWLFEDEKTVVAVHGSMNQTGQGMSSNVENITISRPWVSSERDDEVKSLAQYFESLLADTEDGVTIYELSEAKKKQLIQQYKDFQPRPAEYNNRISSTDDKHIESLKRRITLPSYLNYKTGDFAHQGYALQSWIDAKFSGIFNMATGSGKTVTSLICAHHFQEINNKLMLFISAPQRPLMMQWIQEVSEFGMTCENISEMDSWESREKAIIKAERLLKYDAADAAVFVISNTLLKHKKFKSILSKLSVPKMLIADECHNFGNNSLSEELRIAFEAKLGLSATPDRQYDELGTQFLKSFLGEVCFTFSLEDAIGKCLTPYDYHIIPVFFDSLEMDEFIDLTSQIGKLSWQSDSEDSQMLDHLKRQRRKLIETAEMKIPTMKGILKDDINNLEHTLIYCTDKDPEQIKNINNLLSSLNAMFRQVTSEETSSNKLVEKILASFRLGNTKILTAKRVLDEGVDIPQTKRAYFLASNTVERQWTQRRGRILRKCNEINKEYAEIFDFVVLPFGVLDKTPDEVGEFEKKLISLELPRLREFSRLSRNKMAADGPLELLLKLELIIHNGSN